MTRKNILGQERVIHFDYTSNEQRVSTIMPIKECDR